MRVVILGNGIAGSTAARHIRKLDDKVEITLISGESPYFFSRTALMYAYMGHMPIKSLQPYEASFWPKNRIDLVFETVTKVNFESNLLELENGTKLSYDKLILASGSKPRILNWPGVNGKGVQGFYSLQDLTKLENYSTKIQNAVIIGAGLIGIELAEMLLSRGKKVSILIRESRIWSAVLSQAESDLLEKHFNDHHCNLIYHEELEEILLDDQQQVKGIRTKNKVEISCEFIGLTVGVEPNISFLKDSELAIDRGIVVNNHLETSIPNVYAIGDCAQLAKPAAHRNAIEPVWYTGRMMGEVVAINVLNGNQEYLPGIWFNSAKFFDIEYHTYGKVSAEEQGLEKHFFWKHKDKQVFMRLAYNKETLEFLGINSFACRLRHEVFDKWLTAKLTINQVIEHLPEAMFNPEFTSDYSKDILENFNSTFSTQLKHKTKKFSFFKR